MINLSQLESSLWEAADNLRANSKLTATEYSMPVLGLIFLRHATNRFEAVKVEVEAGLPSRGGKKRAIKKEDFVGKAALFLPEKALYGYILKVPAKDKADTIKQAMETIEDTHKPLQKVLPKGDYATFDPGLLDDLVRTFDREELRTATGDVFGRIYEYFLNKFAMSGAQEGGEFFTPPSLVRTIVNVIEPSQGVVFDPACGSAGMFVQTGYFIEKSGGKASERTTFYGQEKSETNTRLAKMNLAVHGLDGNIQLGNTFYDRRTDLIGACDYVMSNPPFNVDLVNPDKLAGDTRLFTEKRIPGISAKTKTVSNANYLWIQYYYSYLKPTGRAGFVMASLASDAGHGEKEIREEIIATGDVDVIISIGTNFFYTRSLPCTLWFFDRGKPKSRKDKVLMIDARNLYRVVSRKLRDFSEEHLQNISAIVWLYRGESERYLALVQDYLIQTYETAMTIKEAVAAVDEPVQALVTALKALVKTKQAELKAQLVQGELLEEDDDNSVDEEALAALEIALTEQVEAMTTVVDMRQSVGTELETHFKDFEKQALETNEDQKVWAKGFEVFSPKLKGLQKQINEALKLTNRAVDLAEKKLAARKTDAWNSKEIRETRQGLEATREQAIAAIKGALYEFHQMQWLQSRFPEAALVDVPGLCKVVTREDIGQQDNSLTPGRYVGVAPIMADDDEDFEERMREIHQELAELNDAAADLAGVIAENFEDLAL